MDILVLKEKWLNKKNIILIVILLIMIIIAVSLFFILRENFWKDTGVRHTISLCWCWILWDLVFLR